MAVISKPGPAKILEPLVCANWRNLGPACRQRGALTCEKCHLVLYCSEACKDAHASVHEADCRHIVVQDDWLPTWMVGSRTPGFIGDDMIVSSITRRLLRIGHSYGKSPAMDLLDLENNERSDGPESTINILSVGGDVRNGIQTVARLPDSFTGTVKHTLGDDNTDGMMRTIIIILISLAVEDKLTAVDLIIHVWYSAYLRPFHVFLLTEILRPMIAEAYVIALKKSRDAVEHGLYGHRIGTEERCLLVWLTVQDWRQLLDYFTFEPENDTDEAPAVVSRYKVVCGEGVADERDLILLRNSPHRRVAIMKYWKEGILQPFGQDGKDFSIPNPFLFHGTNWILEELADPFDGWDFGAAVNSGTALPHSDIYGRLSLYLHEVLGNFVTQLRKHNVIFQLFHVGPEHLYKYAKKDTFARIDISEVTEELQPEFLFENYGPLLQRPDQNPHAAMFGLYFQGIENEVVKNEDLHHTTPYQRYSMGVLLQMDVTNEPPYSAKRVQLEDALPLFINYDAAFDRFVRSQSIDRKLRRHGMKLKSQNRIVKPWPTRLELDRNDDLLSYVKQAFNQAIASRHSGNERIVEFTRISDKLERICRASS